MKIFKKKNVKENLKRAGLWVTVFVILFGAVTGSAAYAADQVTVANAKALIDDAAKKQLVANKFSDCMGDRKGGEDYNRTYNCADEIAQGKWFNDALLGKTAYAVGPWLESQTHGNFSDGKIWCEENILPMFLNTFGYSITEVACNKFSDSGNGHLSGGIFKTYNDTNCEAMDNVAYYKVQKDDARAYIGKLYDEAVKDNPYAKKWSEDVSYYDPVVGYILYKQDFDTACAASYETDATNTEVFSKKVKTVNDKGEIEEFYVTPKSGMRDGSSSGKSFVSGGPETCIGLIDKLNSYAENYQEKILEAIKIECASDDVKKKVQEYIKKYEDAESLTDDEKKELDKLKKARDSGDYTQATTKGGLECAEFKDLAIKPTSPSPTTGPGGGEDGKTADEEKCYENAKSLGWVICPIIYGLREMTENLYTAIEPLLQTHSSVVGQLGDTNSGLYKAWGTFRNMANIVFVILFLFVIFSQLTGYGIDNYGIKKMLPKLILTAILVNLSFIICAVAVDISNIVGSSIKGFLESIAVSSTSLGGDSAHAVGAITQKVVGFIALIGTGAAVLAIGFALEGWAIIIPILLFLLTIVIAVFFALVVLGLRQALVVILIVLSPLAFVCMVLPNTEGVYKKWWAAAKGILTVYPVIGAVIGAGYLTASILMSVDEGFIMTLVAGILMVGPYFMIPSLTRKSLDAVGKLGERVGNFGKGVGDKASKRINNTQAVKNAKNDSTAQRAQARAAKYMNSQRARDVENDIKAGRKVSMRRANKYARAASLANSDRSAIIGARSAQSQYERMRGTGFDAAMSAATMAEDTTTTKNWETMIAAGNYSYQTEATDADGNTYMESHTVDSQNNQQLADALEHELSQDDAHYDANKVRALSNALAAKGKDGRDKMYSAVSNAQTKGASSQAIKDFSSNIMNNHAGTMKDKARSLYEFAKATSDAAFDEDGNLVPQYKKDGSLAAGYAQNGDGSFSLANASNFATAGTGSLTAADMTNMDKQQLARYAENASGSQLETLGALAHQALTDEHLSQTLNNDNRALLETLRTNATNAGYDVTKNTPTDGSVFNVRQQGASAAPSPSATQSHSSATQSPTTTTSRTTPQTPPSQTAAAQGAANNIATQNAARINDAIRNRRDVASTRPNIRSAEDAALRAIQNGAGSNVPKNTIVGPDGKPLSSGKA